MVYDSIGIFSDSHLPYHHQDTFNFYRAIDSKYKPKIWIHIGDDTDGHAWSYHESSTKLANADLEWERAKKAYQNFFEIVGPDRKCFVVSSNHGCLAERKGQTAGLPSQILKGAYKTALEAPPNFVWVEEAWGGLPDGSKVLFHHGFSSKNSFLVAKERGHHIVTGHHHTELKVPKILYLAWEGIYGPCKLVVPSIFLLRHFLMPIITNQNQSWALELSSTQFRKQYQ